MKTIELRGLSDAELGERERKLARVWARARGMERGKGKLWRGKEGRARRLDRELALARAERAERARKAVGR